MEELAAQVARSSRNEAIPGVTSPPAAGKGGGRGQLTAIDGGLIKDPIVTADRERGGHMFKALVDKGAQRAAIFSTIGLVLCIAPVLSLIGLIWGITSLRRIKRSAGALTGEKTARFAIYLGAIGLAIGATIDMIVIIRG